MAKAQSNHVGIRIEQVSGTRNIADGARTILIARANYGSFLKERDFDGCPRVESVIQGEGRHLGAPYSLSRLGLDCQVGGLISLPHLIRKRRWKLSPGPSPAASRTRRGLAHSRGKSAKATADEPRPRQLPAPSELRVCWNFGSNRLPENEAGLVRIPKLSEETRERRHIQSHVEREAPRRILGDKSRLGGSRRRS